MSIFAAKNPLDFTHLSKVDDQNDYWAKLDKIAKKNKTKNRMKKENFNGF